MVRKIKWLEHSHLQVLGQKLALLSSVGTDIGKDHHIKKSTTEIPFIVEADGNLSVRFLGIDTPELSFPLPGNTRFINIESETWDLFLSAPFKDTSREFLTGLGRNR